MRLIYSVFKEVDTMAFQLTTVLLILCTQCVLCVASNSSSPCNVTVSPSTLKVEMNHSDYFTLTLCHNLTDSLTISFVSDEKIATVQKNVTIEPNSANEPHKISVTAHSAGSTVVNMSTDEGPIDVSKEYVQITVIHSDVIDIISTMIGWIYFTVWSISFYPQVWLNFQRKSVVGLSFDFLAYNFTGFLAYGVFNVALYWIDSIKEEYNKGQLSNSNPVQLNDVVFTLHALFITSVTIFQTFIYERGEQKVTILCWTLQSVAWVFVAVILIITAVSEERLLTWLQFVTFISYIKLSVTLIKYVPQVWMNFRRKSTVGWSIGNVLLDFTGGTFSILQMFLLSYNSNDWSSFFGDPTKFGLGLFSICFDIVFILQHYVWYGGEEEKEEGEATGETDVERLINTDPKDNN